MLLGCDVGYPEDTGTTAFTGLQVPGGTILLLTVVKLLVGVVKLAGELVVFVSEKVDFSGNSVNLCRGMGGLFVNSENSFKDAWFLEG